jgi:hypothetical protein
MPEPQSFEYPNGVPIVNLIGCQAYRDWVLSLSDHLDATVPKLIEAALAAIATQSKFTQPPKRLVRMPKSRRQRPVKK